MRIANKTKRELTLLEVNIVCVLLFLASILMIVRYPNWFG
jgi:competence protein ComGC